MADYAKLKVTELRDLLKERGIPSTGLTRKQQMVEALQEDDKVSGDESATAAAAGGSANDTSKLSTEETRGDDAGEDGSEWQGMKEGEDSEEDFAASPLDGTAPEPAQESHLLASPSGMEMKSPVPDNTSSQPIPEVEKVELASNDAPTSTASRQLSPSEPAASSEARKRKWRSPTPPLSAESVNKKLKGADDAPVRLPEDDAIEDTPMLADAHGQYDEGTTSNPTQTMRTQGDDAMDIHEEVEVSQQQDEYKVEREQEKIDVQDDQDVHAKDVGEEEAIHPESRALYIRNLVRPLQPQQLRHQLISAATSPEQSLDDSVIEVFHLDALRTHAFVIFTTLSAATRARSSLHNRIWPEEPMRKPLWVDYLPADRVQGWIDTELDSPSGHRDAKRWEIEYSNTDDVVITKLREATPASAGPRSGSGGRQASFPNPQVVGPGMPNAPTGPRGDRAAAPQSPIESRKPSRPLPISQSFDVLDERFRFTNTKPKLYYLPVDAGLAEKRLDELDALTSRQWDERMGEVSLAGGNDDIRRYTFEDGHRLVDGGPDIGSFGRGPLPSGGRGRGGWRGRR